jgi:uncharacterized protein HemX
MNDQNLPEEDIVLRHEPDESPPLPAVTPARNTTASGRRSSWLLGVALIGVTAVGVWYWQGQRSSRTTVSEHAILPGDAELAGDRHLAVGRCAGKRSVGDQ